MNSLRAISRPDAAVSSFFIFCYRSHARLEEVYPASRQNYTALRAPHHPTYSSFSASFLADHLPRMAPASRRTLTRAANWDSDKSPYETLELERGADEEKIKIAYRRLAKFYHPDGVPL